MNEIQFNLLDDGWIPCLMQDNKFNLLGIRDTFLRAPEILDISSDNPLVTISIYRLLLAILHRNFGPKDSKEWLSIYKKGSWDQEPLKKYFLKWGDKFELFNDKENRFYQVEMPEISKKTPITKLNHALASGNNAALFDHNWDKDVTPINIEKAAQLLIAFQSFAVGGGRSSPFYFSHAPLISTISVILKGKNLFETIMLNFIRYDKDHPFPTDDDKEDIPFWEREDKSLCEEKDGRMPYGYLDYLTWQSRRIWLIPEIYKGIVKIKKVFLAQGEKVDGDWCEDPQMVYKLDEKNKKIPLKLNPDRLVWRDIEALLRLNDSASKYKSPDAINWISRFISMGILDSSNRYNIEVFGLCNDPKKAARILNWHHSSIPLPLKFLEDQSLVDNVQQFILKCEEIEKILSKTVYFFGKDYLFPSTSALSKKQNNEVRKFTNNYQLGTQYWNRIENYFYKLMVDIAQEPSFEKRLELIKEYINLKVVKTARELFSDLYKNLKDDPRALKPLIQNKSYLGSQLHNIKQKLM